MRLLEFGLLQIHKTLGLSEPSYHTIESDEYTVFRMGVPGLKEKDIDIKIIGKNRIVIKSLRASRFTPEFYYAFAMPCNVIRDETYASIVDGILSVRIAKDVSKINKININ